MATISIWLTWTCVTVFVIILFKWLIKYLTNWKTMQVIPGPKSFPFIGQMFDFIAKNEDFISIMDPWWKRFRTNPTGLFRVQILTENLLIPCNSEMVEKCINTQLEKLSFYDFLKPWLGDGLLVSNGEKWHKRRKMLTPTFHFRILEDFLEIFNEQGKIMVANLKKNENKTFDMFSNVTLCTLDIICETAMGISMNAQANKDSDYVKAIYGISEIIHSRMFSAWKWPELLFALSSDGRNHKKYLQILHSFTKKVISDRKITRSLGNKNTNSKEDEIIGKKKRLAFLDLLLDASENGNQLSDGDIQEEVDTFMFEGHDTTAAAICWVLYLLGHHPDVQDRVQREIDSIFGTEDRYVTSEDIRKLKYLECVIKESLRIYPSVPMFSRTAKTDFTLGNYKIPQGTTISFALYFLHRDPRIFPEPERFRPERFLQTDSPDRHPYSFIPFSAGSRNCIGQKFALMEEKVILTHFLRSYNVKSMERREDIKLLLELILRPKNGIMVQITPRKPFYV